MSSSSLSPSLAPHPSSILQILSGKIPLPDTVLCTLAMIDDANRVLSRFLGPKNLMPNVKRGTVFSDVTQGIMANRGAVEWKVNKTGQVGTSQYSTTRPYLN